MKMLISLATPAVCAMLLLGGCTSTILKEGGGAVFGASGSFMPIQPVDSDKAARPLGAYQRFEIGSITDDIGGRVPGGLIADLHPAFESQLRSKKLPNVTGGKTLVIRGRIVHYETSDMLGFALGPLEEVIVRAEFVDADTGQVLGVANCIGRTKARINAGVKKKAEGLAKAFAEWIDSRYPKEGRQ
jgi:hypothetical protein